MKTLSYNKVPRSIRSRVSMHSTEKYTFQQGRLVDVIDVRPVRTAKLGDDPIIELNVDLHELRDIGPRLCELGPEFVDFGNKDD